MSSVHPNQSPSPSGEGLGWGSATTEVLAERAHTMRQQPTEWEKRLWRALSNRQLAGFKFRRQAVIGNRIVDFFCPAIGLIVEIDGDTHDPEIDQRRDAAAARLGLTTVRFTNHDVAGNIAGVLEAIACSANALPPRTAWQLPTPTPPLKGRG